jgi:alkanesulfonate monooxygenase SsuD/methylene tetrahydromethanopterin reductase-like flavin-dependent oxidoreductase (luciferase family)
MVGVNVIAADTDAEARRVFTSLQQQFLNLVRGRPGQLPPPVDDMDALWNVAERSGRNAAAGAFRERLLCR